MKKWIFSSVVVAVVAVFAVILLPAKQVQAACGTVLTGSFPSTAPNQTTSTFAVLAGDVVTATATDSAGTATGIGADININGTFYGAGQTSNVSRTTVATAPANGTAYVFFYNNSGTGGTLNWTVSISGPNCGGGFPTYDDRVNPQAWATAVLYCRDEAIHVYDVDTASVGRVLFVVTPEEIAELGVPSVNTVLEQGLGTRGVITLYRLASGEFQVVAPDTQPGKDYTFTWAGC